MIMLMPSEASFVSFLEQRMVPISEMQALPELDGHKHSVEDVAINRAKKLVSTDRNVMLESSKAFVSFTRAYQEHQLQYLFPFKALDMGGLATGFCLLRMPRMKEILGRKINGFEQSDVNPASVPFKIKAQEQVRQDNLQKKKEEEEANALPEKLAAYKKFKEEEKKPKAKAAAEKNRTRGEKRRTKKNAKWEEWRL